MIISLNKIYTKFLNNIHKLINEKSKGLIDLESGKYLIKDTTIEERKKLVNGAIAIQMTDGSAPCDETIKLFQKYIDGEMEIEEIQKELIKKYTKK